MALPGRTVVTDAGGNSLVEVAANGRPSLLATFADGSAPAPPFPPFPPGAILPVDAVPTTVAVGPDGAFYVGQLTGFPFPLGGASIYRVPAEGGATEVYATGFTNIIDIAFDRDGTLFVLEIARDSLLSGMSGRLTQITRDGTRQELSVLNAQGQNALFSPGGIAVGPDGNLYVTIASVLPGAGQVIKLTR